jgi:hypothetical protein
MYVNLIEVHILRAIRQNHQIQLNKVRAALDYVDQEFKVSHPLAREEFRTDGVDLFIKKYGALINASQPRQLDFKNELYNHLERIEADDSGLAIKLYPFTRSYEKNNPKIVIFINRKIKYFI